MAYKKLLEEHLQEFLSSSNINQPVAVTYSDFEDFQYQTPLGLLLRKVVKGFNPQTIADYLLTSYPDFYEEAKVTGPGFVSVKFNLKQLAATPQAKKVLNNHMSKKVIVDYCGVNVAKQMHIGHIRSMFIGDFIVRLHEKLGDEVAIYNHIGDWGNQFGFLLNYIINNQLENQLSNKNLTDYYKLAYVQYQNDESFAQKSMEIAHQLQHGGSEALTQLWKKLVDISMEEAQKTFWELDLKVNSSHTQGESFYAPFCPLLLNKLVDSHVATKNEDGSVAVFFDDKSPLMLQKSNGNFLYALYDLAALEWRDKHVKADKIVYVVDKRQSLHFEQVFEVAKKASLVSEQVELLHVGFGTILGQDKKPLKTKEGESLYLDDLLLQGKQILSQDSHFIDMPEAIKNEILNKTIIGGMKFYDLKFNKSQDYIFDWKHVLNFGGSSAPYIQNALVRIDSIYTKLNQDVTLWTNIDLTQQWNQLEKELLFQCIKTQELLEDNTKNYSSQAITEHSMKICQLFHKYYESEYIAGNPEQDKKLELIGFAYHSLLDICQTLGIQTYRCQQQMLLKHPVTLSR